MQFYAKKNKNKQNYNTNITSFKIHNTVSTIQKKKKNMQSTIIINIYAHISPQNNKHTTLTFKYLKK